MRDLLPRGRFEWWALYLRGLTAFFGVSVLLVGTPAHQPVPLAAVPLVLLLVPAGFLSVVEAARCGSYQAASYVGTFLELLIVTFLVYETGGPASFFYFFYVPVLMWGTAGRGLLTGVVGGWMAALGFAVAASLQETPPPDALPRAALLALIGLLIGLLEQRRADAMAAALRGAEELARRTRVGAEVQAAIQEIAGASLADRARRLLDRVVRLSGAEVGLVAVVDLEGRAVVEAAVDAQGGWRRGESLPRTAVLDDVLQSGLPHTAVDVSADARWASVFGRGRAGSAVLFPLRAGGQTFGAAFLARRDVRLFSEPEVEATEALLAATAPALRDAQMQVQAHEFMMSTVNALAAALEAKDPYTRGHSQRVASNAVALAEEIGLPLDEVERIRWASLLHDIGKIGTPEHILRKRGPLTDEERAIMNLHAERGARILKEFAPFRGLVDYVRYHQEAYDGSGYPEGLAGEAIPLGARIIRIADTFDALISDRPYRRGRAIDEATAELRAMAGSVLDPFLVDVFLRVLQVKPPFEVQLRLWREG
ncbi:MAG: HD domain-containing protein [Armatimonadota bacterium]|nr:HD domain-containing protein [Armatimonadota bacterium]MDR7537058.1 HD domain-containing protein [Armatimonadota bacterium]